MANLMNHMLINCSEYHSLSIGMTNFLQEKLKRKILADVQLLAIAIECAKEELQMHEMDKDIDKAHTEKKT